MSHSRFIHLTLGLSLLLVLAGLAPTAGASPAADNTVWSGEYFNNTTLAGPPVLLRGDPEINFYWPAGVSPAPGHVNPDHYSVRWTRELYFNAAGNWVFTTVNDDGMRVWVDDRITMDAWYDQGPTTHTGAINLSAGWHVVKVEYYNRVMGGTAQVSYALSSAAGQWKGEYFANQNLSGAPKVTRYDDDIDFDWGTGSPAGGIPADHFSVRWSRTLNLSAGTWRFTTTTDDGVRLWVDGKISIDRWYDQSATSYSCDLALASGNHTVRMEYYDDTVSAVARLSYNRVNAPGGTWHGQYFDNISLSGSPVLVRDDSHLDWDWGSGSPDPSVPVNYFSAKWDSVQTVNTSGNYAINATSDDGVRVWMDGALVIDAWYDHGATTFSATRYLSGGAHNVHVEYYERTVNATISVEIVPTSNPPPAPPPPPSTDVIVDDRGAGWQSGGCGDCWRESANGIGGHSYWTWNNTYVLPGYNWARWFPGLPHAGNYEVLAYIPGGLGTTTNARYWIYHNGSYSLAVRSQGAYPYQWVSLGTFYFSNHSGENVSLTDVTYECYLCRTVVFDAVKFSPR